MAAMEPKLRELHRASVPSVPGSVRHIANVGGVQIDFYNDPHSEVRFSIVVGFTTIFSGTMDPVEPGNYCEGRLRVSTWHRGEWEAALGAKVDVFDPRTGDVLPRELVNSIRSELDRWPKRSHKSAAALHDVSAILGDPFGDMLLASIERGPASDAQIDTLMMCVNGPNLGFAVALILALNAGRPTHVRRAWHIAMEKAAGCGGVKLAEKIAGSKLALAPVIAYMETDAPTDDEAEVARFIVEASVTDVVRLDSVATGMIVDRVALTLRRLGVTEVKWPD